MKRLIQRLELLRRANRQPEWAARILIACRSDILFFISNFCWTKDPRPGITDKIIPFVPYEFQESLIFKIKYHIEGGKDLIVEKSRDMGVTWCFLYVFLWFWLFKSGYDFLLGSQTQDDVDQSGNPKSLFPRMRMNLERLPGWMLPDDYSDNFLRLVNKTNENTIVGEANTVNFSRQGRFSAIYMDEFAFWKDSGRKNSDQSAWTAAGDASPCRFAISSAHGKNNHFYKLRSRELSEIELITLHWRLHPHKDDKWYNNEKKRRSPEEVAQELDIDYSASVTNKAAENFNPSIHILVNGEWVYDPKVELQLTCDFNIDPMCWSVSDSAKGEDVTFKEYTERTTITENVIIKFCQDFSAHQNKTIYLYGDRSGHSGGTRSRSTDYDIIKRILKAHGWVVYDHTFLSNPRQMDMINAINKRFKDWEKGDKAFEFITENCKKLIESLEQTQRKDDGLEKDGLEHHFQAFGYRICKKYPIKSREVRQYMRA